MGHIRELEVGSVYRSRSNKRFRVLSFSQYGLDCSVRFILYTNLDPTFDSPPGKLWTIEESIFLKMFKEEE